MEKITLIRDGDKVSVCYRKIEAVRLLVDDVILDKIKNGKIEEVQEELNKKAIEIFDNKGLGQKK